MNRPTNQSTFAPRYYAKRKKRQDAAKFAMIGFCVVGGVIVLAILAVGLAGGGSHQSIVKSTMLKSMPDNRDVEWLEIKSLGRSEYEKYPGEKYYVKVRCNSLFGGRWFRQSEIVVDDYGQGHVIWSR